MPQEPAVILLDNLDIYVCACACGQVLILKGHLEGPHKKNKKKIAPLLTKKKKKEKQKRHEFIFLITGLKAQH